LFWDRAESYNGLSAPIPWSCEGENVHPSIHAGWDNMMFGVPLCAVLLFGYFRVDEIFGVRKHPHTPPPPALPVIDPGDESILTDPDGRPWI
jgi:hypothetical protein